MSSVNSTVTGPDSRWLDEIKFVSSTTVVSTEYGIMLTLYAICCYLLSLRMKQKSERRRCIFLLCYITVMAALGTIFVATTTRATVVNYVYFAGAPGGHSAYNNPVLFSVPNVVAVTTSYIVASWMADAMLLWRLFVLFHGLGSSRTIIIVGFPSVVFLGSVATGLLYIIQTSIPNASLWANGVVNFALPYFVLSVATSVIVTGLILWRILSINQTLKATLGNQANNSYSHICAILVESCALYTVFSLIFIVLYVINNPVQFIFFGALAYIQIIALLLIVFRVSQGNAWKRVTTESTLTDIRFTRGQGAVNDSRARENRSPVANTDSELNITFSPTESI